MLKETAQLSVENNENPSIEEVMNELGITINNFDNKESFTKFYNTYYNEYNEYLNEKIKRLRGKIEGLAKTHANNESGYKILSLNKLLILMEEPEIKNEELRNIFFNKVWNFYEKIYDKEKAIIKGNEKIKNKIDDYIERIINKKPRPHTNELTKESHKINTLFDHAGIDPGNAITNKNIEEWFRYYQQELQKRKAEKKEEEEEEEEEEIPIKKKALVKKPIDKSKDIIKEVKELIQIKDSKTKKKVSNL